ncbi:MAG: hypothetical protein WBE72_18175 [Terracidiphilus sp.]
MATIRELTDQSGFVFEAEVEQLGASSARGFTATKESAVVRVTSILRSPPALANFVGHTITVQLNPSGNIAPGDRAVFFTHGMHYGESLVVAEIGRAAAGDSTMGAQIQNAAAAAHRDQLTQRLAQAELVISGVASEPTAYAAGQPQPVSEHDPDWGTSTIAVESVEKGSHGEPTKDILFARSMDIVWYRAPKVKAGDRGVWLLHRRDPSGKSVPDLAIVHPLDFQPATELENVRTLLGA